MLSVAPLTSLECTDQGNRIYSLPETYVNLRC